MKTVVPALQKEFGYTNVMAVPKVDKVVINIGLGEATGNAKLMDGADDGMDCFADFGVGCGAGPWWWW